MATVVLTRRVRVILLASLVCLSLIVVIFQLTIVSYVQLLYTLPNYQCNCSHLDYDYHSTIQDDRQDYKLIQYIDDIVQDTPNEVLCASLKDSSNDSIPWVFAITPTYKRPTQMLDLTTLCQTLMNVKNIVWIVIEDSPHKTKLVSGVLRRCKVWSIHMQAQDIVQWPKPEGRGIPQRIEGLNWIRQYCNKTRNCTGALYFLDDDNKYDLRLFESIRMTKVVSVWPVAFAGGMLVEGPTCRNGKVEKWHAGFAQDRPFPIDMAGFAVNVNHFISKPNALLGYKPHSTTEKAHGGWQETRFIENFVKDRNDSKLECRGSETDILVWHAQTAWPNLVRSSKNYGLNV